MRAEQDLKRLQSITNSTIIGVKDNIDELGRFVNRPLEITYSYPPNGSLDHASIPAVHASLSRGYKDLFQGSISNKSSANETEPAQPPPDKKRGRDKTKNVWEDLLSAWYTISGQISLFAAEEYTLRYLDSACSKELDYVAKQEALLLSHQERKRSALVALRARLQALKADLRRFARRLQSVAIDPSSMISPKLKLLIDVLSGNHTTSFKCIIFVDERSMAFTLADFLRRIPGLQWARPAALVGHSTTERDRAFSMDSQDQQRVVDAFRSDKVNVVVATSVAEEGLDFQACHLVIRFNEIKTITSYLQSRGRARFRTSTFVTFVAEGEAKTLQRYENFRAAEALLETKYAAAATAVAASSVALPEDVVSSQDVACREPNFTIAETGAILTYDNAVDLLELLCASAPSDEYGVVRTQYTTFATRDGFECTVRLPPCLPLPRNMLQYRSAIPRGSKREARNAAAFATVKALYELGIFNNRLLPVHAKRTPFGQDAYMRPPMDVSDVEKYMTVDVETPWIELLPGNDCWLHTLHLDGSPVVGFVTANWIPEEEFSVGGHQFRISPTESVQFNGDEIQTLTEYTLKLFPLCGLSMENFTPPLAFYLCALRQFDGSACWASMHSLIKSSFVPDWDPRRDTAEENVLVVNRIRPGYLHTMRSADTGLRMLDQPREVDGKCFEKNFNNFYDYYVDIATKGNRGEKQWGQRILRLLDSDSPMVLLNQLPRLATTQYDITSPTGLDQLGEAKPNLGRFAPIPLCNRLNLSLPVATVVRHLPQLYRRIVDIHRVGQLTCKLKLPPVSFNALIEATTLPHSGMGFENQRLETLGDAFLKVGVSVYAFMQFPFKHEGQLTNMRIPSVSNRSLLGRARAKGLQRFLSGESANRKGAWTPELAGVGQVVMPRRSMQECVESLLGAAFADGGVDAALAFGRSMDLCFGEDERTWSARYLHRTPTPSRTLFENVRLGHLATSSVLTVPVASKQTWLPIQRWRPHPRGSYTS